MPEYQKEQRHPDYTPLPGGTKYKTLLVYPNAQRVHTPQLGLAILSACIRRIGGETKLFDVTELPPGTEIEALEIEIADYQPDLVAIGVRSNEWELTKKLMTMIRTREIPFVVGGPQATCAPEETMEYADLMVVGEGEGALLDLVRALATGQDHTRIQNLWCRHQGQVIRNERRALISDLDATPYPDWTLFGEVHYRDSFMKDHVGAGFLVAAIEGSRGCPYTCSYCSNEKIRRDAIIS